jgi:mono/diheme cytochrome c family protein
LKRLLLAILVLAVIGLGGFYVLTIPAGLAALPPHEANAKAGERIFWLGGCGSCHAAERAKGDDKLKLGGGQAFVTEFGTFRAPNISPDETHGIGRWSTLDLANALMKGVSPDGRHYYPAFPYTSYARMKPEDVIDLAAFLKTLPKVAEPSKPHELGFPYNIRRGLGLWKLLYLDPSPVVALSPAASTAARQGQAIAEGVGHCGECHTPRDRFGGLRRDRWLAGAPLADGPGRSPNITPDEGTLGPWSAAEIAEYLETGITPDFTSVGGPMVSVVDNYEHVTKEDRDAVAAYLKAIPPLPKQP